MVNLLGVLTLKEQEVLWDKVNEYVTACGGDPSAATVSEHRMRAVVAVERAVGGMMVTRESDAWCRGVDDAVDGLPGGDEYATPIATHLNNLTNPFLRR